MSGPDEWDRASLDPVSFGRSDREPEATFDAGAVFEPDKHAGSLADLDAAPYRLESSVDDILGDTSYRLEPITTDPASEATFDASVVFEPDKHAGSLADLDVAPYRLAPTDELTETPIGIDALLYRDDEAESGQSLDDREHLDAESADIDVRGVLDEGFA